MRKTNTLIGSLKICMVIFWPSRECVLMGYRVSLYTLDIRKFKSIEEMANTKRINSYMRVNAGQYRTFVDYFGILTTIKCSNKVINS